MALEDAEGNGDGAFHPAATPEELLTSNLASADVEKALGRALAEMADEDRLLMKLYYFDGLRLREAGAVLGVHEATASRRLTRIHGEVRQKGVDLDEGTWLTSAEAERSLSEVAAHLQTDEPMLMTKSD
jgi:DNA-directed RNA polymerase specialized sigma subunit